MLNRNIALKLTNVSKKYFVFRSKPTLAESFISRKDLGFFALNNINLTIKKGERVGIIGANGSGKTTLLKIMVGISSPTDGAVETEGKIISLIDLEAGFHPELSGEENIYLNGLLVGMTKQEIKDRLREIISFADIGSFINAPFYTYSEGMKLRLGLSVCIHTNPDIILLDENMSVGDKEFSQKTHKRIQEFFVGGKTLIIVSHWLDFIKENCDKIIWIDKGKIKKIGGKSVIDDYQKS